MLYLANPAGAECKAAMSAGKLGFIDTPKQGNRHPAGAWYCCDNGKYGKGWPGAYAWYTWLRRTVNLYGTERCVFVTAPDRVADPYGTLADSLPWLPVIRRLGVPAAFVAQDGCENGLLPWGDFDTLFLGGTTEWKLGPAAASVTAEAAERGLPVHMGRVNSRKRLRYAHSIGCATADGTYLTFGPTTNLPKLLSWLGELDDATLF